MKGVGLLDGGSHGTAAQDDVTAVDYNGLAGGDGSLRLVEDEVHVPVLKHRDCRRLLALVVAHARGRAPVSYTHLTLPTIRLV